MMSVCMGWWLDRRRWAAVTLRTALGVLLAALSWLNAAALSPAASASEPDGPSSPVRIVSPSPSFPSLEAERDPERPRSEATDSEAGRLAGPAVTMASSLAVVLGLFAALVWASRRFGSRHAGRGELPAEALERLGSHAIDPRTRLILVRCGERVLVMAHTANGVHPISEISDADEVARLIARCRGETGAALANTLRSMEREPVSSRFVDPESPAPAPRRTLFATA